VEEQHVPRIQQPQAVKLTLRQCAPFDGSRSRASPSPYDHDHRGPLEVVPAAGALDHPSQAASLNRFEKIGDPIRLKRFHCVFVESGDEDNQR